MVLSSISPCKLKLDEEKLNLAGLAQQNGFGPAFLHSLLLRQLPKNSVTNMYDC
jgi:hypothetical protein